jgi:hypothetical protein
VAGALNFGPLFFTVESCKYILEASICILPLELLLKHHIYRDDGKKKERMMAVAETSPSHSMLCPSTGTHATERNGTRRDGTGHPPRITEAKDAYSAPTVLLARGSRAVPVGRRSWVNGDGWAGRVRTYLRTAARCCPLPGVPLSCTPGSVRSPTLFFLFSRARTPCTVRRCSCACSAQHIQGMAANGCALTTLRRPAKKTNKENEHRTSHHLAAAMATTIFCSKRKQQQY